MPTTLTKRAIKESFVNLLNERPLNKISVRDITDKCGKQKFILLSLSGYSGFDGGDPDRADRRHNRKIFRN